MAEKIVSLYQPQMSYAAQIVEVSELFFNEHPELMLLRKKSWRVKLFQLYSMPLKKN